MTEPSDDTSDSKPNFEMVPDPDKAGQPKTAGAGSADPVKAEAAKAEPVKPEAAKAEPAKPEPAKSDASADAARKALAPSAASPVNPFLAAAAKSEERIEEPVVARSLMARMLDYSAHAAIIVGLIGFAWTVGDHVVNRPAKSDPAPVAAAAALPQPTKLDEMAELRAQNQKLRDDLKALKADVTTMRSAARHDTTGEQVRMLTAGLENVRSGLATARSDNGAAIAQLTSKIDKLQPNKLHELGDRVSRLEKQGVDTSSTASIPKPEAKTADAGKTTPKPPAKPTTLASNEPSREQDEEAKPEVISGWVVRDVYQGVALIEGKRGTMEVTRGVTIPGAGVVKSIERHGNGWTITTTKGQLASAAPQQREGRRGGGYGGDGYGPYGGGGYGRGYRYDY